MLSYYPLRLTEGKSDSDQYVAVGEGHGVYRVYPIEKIRQEEE